MVHDISLIFAMFSAFSDCHAGHVMLIDYESRLPYILIISMIYLYFYNWKQSVEGRLSTMTDKNLRKY
jgi:hypothetical protein